MVLTSIRSIATKIHALFPEYVVESFSLDFSTKVVSAICTNPKTKLTFSFLSPLYIAFGSGNIKLIDLCDDYKIFRFLIKDDGGFRLITKQNQEIIIPNATTNYDS